jgi:hypothetical protein
VNEGGVTSVYHSEAHKMTADERKLLQDLADKISQTQAPPKDPEAEDFIRTQIGKRPDALYLMTQTVIIQNIALQNAQQQIQQLQQRAGQPVPASGGGNFLGGQGASGRSQGGYSGQQQYAAPPPQYAAPSPSMPSPGSGGGGFLRGAAQTAAGVAAGTLAADAIASMFTHHGGFGGGWGGFGGGGFGAAPTEEIIENNYYDAPQQQDFGGQQDMGQDVNDDQTQFDDQGQFDNADYDPGDGGGFDDSGNNFV